MRKKRISEAIGNIDRKYIDEASGYVGEEKAVRRSGWIKWSAAAACICLVLGVVAVTPFLQKEPSPVGEIVGSKVTTGEGSDTEALWNETDERNNETTEASHDTDKTDNTATVNFKDLNRPYKDDEVCGEESGISWPWEYLTVYEKYQSMFFEGKEFLSRFQTIDESLLGDVLGRGESKAYEYDYTNGDVTIEHTQTFEVREIKDVSRDLLVAVNMEGEYYVFIDSAIRDEYDSPAALGGLLESFNLPNTLELRRFAVCEGYDTKGYFTLPDDDYIWDILSHSGNAESLDGDMRNEDRRYISFTVTSEKLGIYKHVFYVTEDGYVWTNIFEWGYKYYIGEDAAGKIISYATENAEESQLEPYQYYLAGTLAEIGDGYALIDDSILCTDPADGMVFKVLTEDLRVSRCLDYPGIIKEGDIVMVTFDGEIDVGGEYVIAGASSIDKAVLHEGDVLVEE